ncbi:exosporium leader peptide-containing protein, partial [Bacillus cereus]
MFDEKKWKGLIPDNFLSAAALDPNLVGPTFPTGSTSPTGNTGP